MLTRHLSPETEQKLLAAAEDVAALVSAGSAPNDAIAKAAQDHTVPAGGVDVLVHVYNIGRTAKQRMAGKDWREKAASFPLADTATVLEMLYPDRVKSAAVAAEDTAISQDYMLPPARLLERRHATVQRIKAAAVTPALPELPPLPVYNPRAAIRAAYAKVAAYEQELSQLRGTVELAFTKAAQSLAALGAYLRRPVSPHISTVEKHAALLFGTRGSQVVAQVVATHPQLLKFAHHRGGAPENAELDSTVFGMISQILDEVEHYTHLKTKCAAQTATYATESRRLLDPFMVGPHSIMQGDLPPLKKEAINSFLGGIMGGIAKDVASTAAKDIAPKDVGALKERTLQQLTDPVHEGDLRKIRVQAVLHGLMTNDPIIGAYEPHEVLRAFNKIVEVSPRMADQHLGLQTLLRKHLQQGQAEAFDIDQMLGMEDKMRKRDYGVYGTGIAPVNGSSDKE